MPAELPYGSEQPPNDLKKYAGSGGFGLGRKQHFIEQEENLIENNGLIHMKIPCMKWHVLQRYWYKIELLQPNLLATKQIGKEKGANFNVVTVFPDAGSIEEWADVKIQLKK